MLVNHSSHNVTNHLPDIALTRIISFDIKTIVDDDKDDDDDDNLTLINTVEKAVNFNLINYII